MLRAQLITEQIRSVTTLKELRERRQAALADLEQAVKLDPKQPQAYLLIATLNMLPGGSVKDVREALDKALGLGIDDPAVRAKALLWRATMQEQPEKKLADLNEAVKLRRATPTRSVPAARSWPEWANSSPPWPISTSSSS